jgi:hypothetical protein
MNTLKNALALCTAALTVALLVTPLFAEEPKTDTPAASPAAGQPNDQEMMAKMMELAKLGENHKVLADIAGDWSYTVRMWMNPDAQAEPMISKGTATRKPLMGGRFYQFNVKGQMEMPGADGKMKKMEFNGMALEGYDNVKQKFVSTWMDNMGTGILMSEGTYDPATKSFTFNAEMEMMPGMKTKVREVVRVVDKDHHTLEWYEDRGGKEAKTMEINYTRKK